MSNFAPSQDIDFTIDRNELYREESITDLKVGSIRRLVPIKEDGTDDESRAAVYFGETQLMSPEGPVPLQSKLVANNLAEAIDIFPQTMQQALVQVIERLQQMQAESERNQKDDSRIIVPGRNF